jgi:Ca2+/H+ antiporter
VDVVKAALIGAILANSLLVLGLAVTVGGLKHGTQRFSSASPRMIATLMLISVTALAVPTLAHHLASVPFSLQGDAPEASPAQSSERAAPAHAAWPLTLAITLLTAAGIAAAFASEWFVDAMLRRDAARAAATRANRSTSFAR